MKNFNMLKVLVCLLLTFTVSNGVSAAEGALKVSSDTKTALEIHEKKRERAAEMLGHISMASISIDLNMKESALSHLKSAREIATRMEKDSPTYKSSDTFTAGKVTYSYEDTVSDYYVPVIDNVLVLRDIELNSARKSDPQFSVTNTSFVYFKMDLNVQTVGKSIDNAIRSLTANEYESAQLALNGIYDDALIFEDYESDLTQPPKVGPSFKLVFGLLKSF